MFDCPGTVLLKDPSCGQRRCEHDNEARAPSLPSSACLLASYGPPKARTLETKREKFIAIIWSIFNLGSAVGVSVAAGRNRKSTANAVDDGTSFEFLFLNPYTHPCLAFLANSNKMIRSDGTKMTTP
ncbi:hypothetical protein EV421DRAFT_100832 [Armillaria borealis]|uniref:Uncharacterized protein n=1 Tax=Armillaria borealis TaxID=47425 RepID=A0AA39N497_9AGAR|nr:hypothetical protein EV421DRAFT_100832 [Armillaria borealis]